MIHKALELRWATNVNSCVPDVYAVPVPLGTPVLLIKLTTK